MGVGGRTAGFRGSHGHSPVNVFHFAKYIFSRKRKCKHEKCPNNFMSGVILLLHVYYKAATIPLVQI